MQLNDFNDHYQKEIAARDAKLAEQDSVIAEKDSYIAKLEAQVAGNKNK